VANRPQVSRRLLASDNVYKPVTADPGLRGAEGAVQVGQQVTRESTILAYIDVFQCIAVLTALTAAWLLVLILWRRYHAWHSSLQTP